MPFKGDLGELLLDRGGVPRSLGGVPEIVVDMPIAGDDLVTMAGDEDARPDGLGSGASLNPESVGLIPRSLFCSGDITTVFCPKTGLM